MEISWNELEQEAILLRRTIHRYAETGGCEVKTSALIKEEAKAAGLPVITMKGTGCVVVLDTKRPGKHLALRADMDALPIPEAAENNRTKKACVSENPATCHACGHDAHTAMLLCVMKALVQKKEELCGAVYFCFEQGEENRSGYAAMLDTLSRCSIDSVFGIHVAARIKSGLVGITPGAISTGVIPISVTIHGQGGHSSCPELCKNPLIPAAEFVGAAHAALYQTLPAASSLSMALTTIHCGSARNIIAEHALVEGCMRYTDPNEGMRAKKAVMDTARLIAAAHGCTVQFDPVMDSGYIPVKNDESCTERARQIAAKLWGSQAVLGDVVLSGSESFGYYTDRYPGVFIQLGTGSSEKGTDAQHHNPHFDVDEDMLIRGIMLTVCYTENYLAEDE